MITFYTQIVWAPHQSPNELQKKSMDYEKKAPEHQSLEAFEYRRASWNHGICSSSPSFSWDTALSRPHAGVERPSSPCCVVNSSTERRQQRELKPSWACSIALHSSEQPASQESSPPFCLPCTSRETSRGEAGGDSGCCHLCHHLLDHTRCWWTMSPSHSQLTAPS